MACEIRSVISWLRRTESHEAAKRARHSLVFEDDVTVKWLIMLKRRLSERT